MKRTVKTGNSKNLKDPKSRGGMGRTADGTLRVSINRMAKLSGYSVASVVAKRKQGYTDEEIVTQGLARMERDKDGNGNGKEPRPFQAPTKVFAPTSNSTSSPVDSTRSRESAKRSPLPPPPVPPPPPPIDVGESLDPIDIPSETYSQAALREKIAMANKREMEELVMRGILVQAEEVAQVWARIGGQIRDELLAIPDRISIRLDQRPYREIREILMGEVRRVLMGISEDAGKQAEPGDQSDTDGDDDPTLDSISAPISNSTVHQPTQSV